jgi:hypothetical protein
MAGALPDMIAVLRGNRRQRSAFRETLLLTQP